MQKYIEITHRKNISNALYITSIAIDHHPIDYISLEGRSNYQWYYCLAGHGELIIHGESILLHENCAYLIPPFTGYQLVVLTEDWTLDILEFTGKICKDLMTLMNMENGGAYYFPRTNYFHDQMLQINELDDRRPATDYIEFSTLCYETLLGISERVTHMERKQFASTAPEIHPAIAQIVGYIEEHYNEPISLDLLAEETGLTKKYMCSLYKKAMGRTIITELTYIRVAHARIFLKQFPSKRGEEIAQMCGFDNSSYFGKVFKKITGHTPDEFRKNQNLE